MQFDLASTLGNSPRATRLLVALAAIALALLLGTCAPRREDPRILAVWLPDMRAQTLEKARAVRLTACRATPYTLGAEGQFQEWLVTEQQWQSCLQALSEIAAQTSLVPVDWLYSIRTRLKHPATGNPDSVQFIVDVPEFRARFAHLTSRGLYAAVTSKVDGGHFDGHQQPVYALDADGNATPGALREVWLDEASGRYQFTFNFAGQDGGTLSVDSRGAVGAFTLKGRRYQLELLADGTQLLTVQPPVDFKAHSPAHVGGVLLGPVAELRATQAAMDRLAEYAAAHPEYAQAWPESQRPRTTCPAHYAAPTPGSQVDLTVLFVYSDDASFPLIPGPAGIPDLASVLTGNTGPNWDEIGETLAMGATDAFRRQQLATRVHSVGSVALHLSEDYWYTALQNAYGRTPKQFPYSDRLDIYRDLMLLAQGAQPLEHSEQIMSGAIAADPQLREQFNALIKILTQDRFEKKADIVALIAGGKTSTVNGTYCGSSAALRATLGTAFMAMRLDCALFNYSFIHELGHLLGARHEHDSYRCLIDPKTGNRIADPSYKTSSDTNECDLDDSDYGKCTHVVKEENGQLHCAEDRISADAGTPAPFRDRGYIDEAHGVGTLMTSGSSRAIAYGAYVGPVSEGYTRRPLWSVLTPRSFDGIDISNGDCCDDGAIVDAYAAACISALQPAAPLPPQRRS